jgi:4-amino-4-deoxy-L-arabinose transferase-like glycosyltransferase
MKPRAAFTDGHILLALIFAAFALKLAFVAMVLPHYEVQLSPTYGIDRGDLYDRLAKSLLNGEGYRFTPDTAPTLLREPGYPVFLVAISSLTGYSVTLVRIANLVLTSLSAWLIAVLVRRLTMHRAAYFLGPLLFMLHPGVLIADLRVGVEPLFTLLLLCFLLTLGSALRSRRTSGFIIAGVTLGLVVSVRSTALLFPLCLPLYFLIWDRPHTRPAYLLKQLAALYCACILVLTPWILRNYALVHQFVPTASVFGTSAHSGYYMCTHEDSDKTRAELDVEAALLRGDLAQAQGYRVQRRYYQFFYDARDEVAFNRFLAKTVFKQYLDSPQLFARCASENAFNFWFRGKDRTVTLANILVQLPYLVLGVLGMLFCMRRSDPATLGPLLLYLAYGMAIYLPILAQARYSIPLVPLLAAFSAIALCRLFWPRSKRQGDRPPMPPAAEPAPSELPR